jgi:hypothetical protein
MTALDPPICDEITATSRHERIDRHGQEFQINRRWWAGQLACLREATGIDAPLCETRDGTISRKDLFLLGKEAHTNPTVAFSTLWSACAWGKGRRVFGVKPMLQSVKDRRPDEALCKAAELARRDPVEAFAVLIRPQGNLIKGLGPSFATKYLYFAGGGNRKHPCLILDKWVARALRKLPGWDQFPEWGPSADDYKKYCEILAQWAKAKSKELERTVGGDEFERCLFELGKSAPRPAASRGA